MSMKSSERKWVDTQQRMKKRTESKPEKRHSHRFHVPTKIETKSYFISCLDHEI